VTERTKVVLRDAPVVDLLDVLSVLDGLHREVQLADMMPTPEGEEPKIEADVVEGFVTDRARLEVQRHSIHDQARAARDAGLEVVDITIDYGPEEVQRVLSATSAIARADDAAREDRLLAPPMTPRQRALWEWMDTQFRSQIEGGEPLPAPPL
jgi:hypothetical protein